MRCLVLLLAVLPTLTLAEVPMTGAEFDAYTMGKTLSYAVGSEPYGIEQYLAGRRVVWAFVGTECRRGSWYEAGEQICFVYDDAPGDQQCWLFFQGNGRLTARFVSTPDGTELVAVDQSPDPMFCPGPDIGV